MRNNWVLKKLGEVCTLQRGFDLPAHSRQEGLFPLVSSNGITDRIDSWKVKAPGVVTGRSGSIGNIHFIEEDYWPLNTALYVKDFHGNYPRYVYYLLSYFDLQRFTSGAGVPTLNRNHVHNEEVLISVSLHEQQRIVSILDEAFTAISKAKANTEQNLKNAKALFESELQAIFENKGEGWKEKYIDKVCEEIFAGGDAPKDNFSLAQSNKYNIPIYANAVKANGLYGYTNSARVIKPSITIAARGSGTGHTEIRYNSYFPIVRLIVLIPDLSLVTLEFLKYSIGNLTILRSGSAIPQLTVPMLKEYKIPFPSIQEQQSIVRQLDALRAEIHKLEAIYQQKLHNLEELKKSILQKAFSGELVTKKSNEITYA